MKRVYKTVGMKCGNCAANIKGHLMEVDGVQSVEADLENKTITVESTKDLSLQQLNETLVGTNYKLED